MRRTIRSFSSSDVESPDLVSNSKASDSQLNAHKLSATQEENSEHKGLDQQSPKIKNSNSSSVSRKSGDKIRNLSSKASSRTSNSVKKGMAVRLEKLLLDVVDLDQLSPEETADYFLLTEQHYFNNVLRVIYENYSQRLNAHCTLGIPIVEYSDIQIMFSNLHVLYDFHKGFLQELTSLRFQGLLLKQLGKIILKRVPFFKVYSSYVVSYQKAISHVEHLVHKNQKFQEFNSINESIFGSNLVSLIAAPAARLPQYLIFLAMIHQKLVYYSTEAIDIADSISCIQNVTDEISRRLKEDSKRSNVIVIQERFGNSVELVTPTRFVIRSGNLKQIQNRMFAKSNSFKKYFFVLFNDLLIYGACSSNRTGKIKEMFALENVSAKEIVNGTIKNVRNAFRIDTKEQTLMVFARNAEDRDEWISSINEASKKLSDLVTQRKEMVKHGGKSSSSQNSNNSCNPQTQDNSSIPYPPPCPLSCEIPKPPPLPFSFDIPEAPMSPISCFIPNAPPLPLDFRIPPAPSCPDDCFIPEPPLCPPLPDDVNILISATDSKGTWLDEDVSLSTQSSIQVPSANVKQVKKSISKTKSIGEDVSTKAGSDDEILFNRQKTRERFSTISAGDRNIFSQIKAGVKLRKVDDNSDQSPNSISKIFNRKEDDLQTALQKSLMRYRQFVTNDVHIDDGGSSSDEWD